jgi:hypothetical protein
MYGSIGEFGDARLAARGAKLFEDVVSKGTIVLRRLGSRGAGERGAGRFLANPKVQREEIVDTVSQRTAQQCARRRIVVAQDTTEINFAGREARRRGLGPAGDGKSAGFLIHAAVAIDIEDEAVVGVIDAEIWSRKGGALPDRKARPFEDKESRRWLTTMQHVAERAADAEQLIVVGDRESDIYDVFARRPAGVELVVRAARDRNVRADNDTIGRLFDQPAAWPVLGTMTVKLPPQRIGDKAREAILDVRAARVRLQKPRCNHDTSLPAEIELILVESRELDPPPGQKPVCWFLLSTLPAEDFVQAQQIVRLYRLRWRIEQLFRALKNDGLALPDTQVAKAEHLLKLAAIALAAAVRTIQLVDARHGSPRPATDVVDEKLITPIAVIGASLEGKTELQKNHHPRGSLAWLAWVVARLGGWNCYGKPPGPKTMQIGWKDLTTMIAGYLLPRPSDVSLP